MNCGGPNDELCAPPDVCADANDSRERHLSSQHTNEHDSRIAAFMKRDKPLIFAIVLLVVCLNFYHLRYALYPFLIFSTWIHEMCHGMMAIMVGGGIQKLMVYKDGSGLCYTYTYGETWQRAFVASAGYTGTALIGGILLLFRRTRRGPTVGCIGIGLAILLSCALYVRNAFGAAVLPIIAIVIILCAWKLKQQQVGYLYSFLAATCAFNAISSIKDLFAGTGYVNGQPVDGDAHTVAELWGGSYASWATCWLIFAIAMSLIGLLFAFDGLTYKHAQKQQKPQAGQVTHDYYNAGDSSQQIPIAIY